MLLVKVGERMGREDTLGGKDGLDRLDWDAEFSIDKCRYELQAARLLGVNDIEVTKGIMRKFPKHFTLCRLHKMKKEQGLDWLELPGMWDIENLSIRFGSLGLEWKFIDCVAESQQFALENNGNTQAIAIFTPCYYTVGFSLDIGKLGYEQPYVISAKGTAYFVSQNKKTDLDFVNDLKKIREELLRRNMDELDEFDLMVLADDYDGIKVDIGIQV